MLQRIAPPFHYDIAHFVATVVKLFARGLPRHFGIKRKKQHTPLGAKALKFAARMPPLAKAFRRKHYQPPASLCDGVAAGFLARAHESAYACATWPYALCACDGLLPFFATLDPLARTAERLYNRKTENSRVAVAKPFAPKKIKFSDAAKILAVAGAYPMAARILANVARKRRELAVGFDYPIMPLLLEDMQAVSAACGTTLSIARRKSAAGCRADGGLPIRPLKMALQLPDDFRQSHSVFYVSYLYQQMDVVWHYRKAGYRLDAPPNFVEAPDDPDERARNRIELTFPRRDNFGKRLQPLMAF